MQSVRLSVELCRVQRRGRAPVDQSVCVSLPRGPPTQPGGSSRSAGADRPWSRGCNARQRSVHRDCAGPSVRPSARSPALPPPATAHSYLPAQMFPTLTYLSERAYRRPLQPSPARAPLAYIYYRIERSRRVPFPSGSTTTTTMSTDLGCRCGRINRAQSIGRRRRRRLQRHCKAATAMVGEDAY